jgi:ubiquitin-like protein Pup
VAVDDRISGVTPPQLIFVSGPVDRLWRSAGAAVAVGRHGGSGPSSTAITGEQRGRCEHQKRRRASILFEQDVERTREEHPMATRDSGGQERQTRKSEDVEETQVEEASDVQERVGKLTDDVDALLDEIDDVLEEDAEAFVRSYVQKGGE